MAVRRPHGFDSDPAYARFCETPMCEFDPRLRVKMQEASGFPGASFLRRELLVFEMRRSMIQDFEHCLEDGVSCCDGQYYQCPVERQVGAYEQPPIVHRDRQQRRSALVAL